MLELCRYNKLDIRLPKTYFMFVTYKIIVMPKEITIRNKLTQFLNIISESLQSNIW